ncbi:uncharacterized protein F4807DRAFT_240236 [Annulohypoxylon truncatum]|uniref:uncharacterized protein n=1 Tax=Annulohypoxylon truncatum TaxID=327061 RepID=UPI0020079FC6|nr:uncharacterized protein F4807DRAFT_240236 [Annulohypoxylon truncatum]KAI1206185.1 hypothetical protein F4807DRAFT_240236 [Annulohypoxylon truncatum]
MYGVGGDTFRNFLPMRDFVKEDKSSLYFLPPVTVHMDSLLIPLVYLVFVDLRRFTPRRVFSRISALCISYLIPAIFFDSTLIFLEIPATCVGSLSVRRVYLSLLSYAVGGAKKRHDGGGHFVSFVYIG